MAPGGRTNIDRRLAAVLLPALLLAACSGGDGGDATTAPSAAPTTSSTPPTSAATTTSEPTGARFEIDATGCPASATAPIEGDIVIGGSLALTGGAAALYAPFAAGFRAVIERTNAAGGVDGHTLVLDVRDDGADPAAAALIATDLVNTGAALVAGVIGTAANEAARSVLNDACVPHLWAASGAPEWDDIAGYPWTTGLLVPYPVEVQALLASLDEAAPGATTVASAVSADQFGSYYADAVTAAAADAGLRVAAQTTIDAADPAAAVEALAAADPDVVVAAPRGGAACIAFLEALAAAAPQFAPVVYLTATCADAEFFRAAGPAANGVLTSSNLVDPLSTGAGTGGDTGGAADDQAVQAFVDALAAVDPGLDPRGIARVGWTAAELTVAALTAAADACPDALTRVCIVDAARNIDLAPSLFRAPLRATLDADDGVLADGTQLLRWSVAAEGFVPVGAPIVPDGND